MNACKELGFAVHIANVQDRIINIIVNNYRDTIRFMECVSVCTAEITTRKIK